MEILFFKYHGTGNDFIMLDNREQKYTALTKNQISFLCDRHFGIGADGLILLETSTQNDFSMRYFNADGLEGSMCGNGGRCTVHFAKKLGIISDKTQFEAIDGLHFAEINKDLVTLQMTDVSDIQVFSDHIFLDTGSPHHVELVENIANYSVFEVGKQKRYGAPYFEKGSNINFVERKNDHTFQMRTYERGVENETLSCGTGVTAVALAMHFTGKTKYSLIDIEMPGGKLQVSFEKKENAYQHIYLKGPATFVFEGRFLVS